MRAIPFFVGTVARRGRMPIALAVMLAGCGPTQAPESHDNMVDGRGAHAGSFRTPDTGNDGGSADLNTQAGNAQ